MSDQLKARLLRYITAHMDKDLLFSMDEAIRAAYREADAFSRARFSLTGPARPRGQLRRYLIDESLANIWTTGSPSIEKTVPKGEHYVVLCSGNITMSHIELHENKRARPARHRELMVLRNAILEPVNLELFQETAPDLRDSLHVVALVVHPNTKFENQAEPSEIFITVPYTDWSDYHLSVPLNTVLEYYDEQPQPYLVDEAWPTLRTDIQKEESSNNSG